jgi:hypothetical protein
MFVNPQSTHKIHCGCGNTITIVEGKLPPIEKQDGLKLACVKCHKVHTVNLDFKNAMGTVDNAYILKID